MLIKLCQEEKELLNRLCMNHFNNNMDLKANLKELFERFFNPKTRKKTLYSNLQSLKPTEIDLNNMKNLGGKGLIEILDNGKYTLPTPLGILVFTYGGIIPDNEVHHLIDNYHKVVSQKLRSVINKFGKIESLPFQQISPLLFLLYNNNTSKHRGKFKKSVTLIQTIDRINSAFSEANSNSQGTKDRNASLSGYYLTEANNKLGLPVNNEKQHYYIKPDRVKNVEKVIENSIKKNPRKAKISFEAFEKAFEKNSKILFEFGALYSTTKSKESVRKLFKSVGGHYNHRD